MDFKGTYETVATLVGAIAPATPGLVAQRKHENAVLDLWAQGKAAFGVFVPNENPPQRGQGVARGAQPGPRGPRPGPSYTKEGAEKLAMNPLYDFVFLNLEGGYDAAAVKAVAEGLRSPKAVSRKTLIARIPPMDTDGPAAARDRVKEALTLGADGVAIPHVRGLDHARQAVGFFVDANANVWSRSNPGGETIAMIMIEDPLALAWVKEIADIGGYSILACGIGSLAGALGGDKDAAEAGNQKILAETKRVGLVNMLTATTQDIETRVKEGFLALLAHGRAAGEAIKIGRAAAGR